MDISELKNWTLSSYDEGTEHQLDYYINGQARNVGDKAFLYYHEDKLLVEMQIVHIISRTNDIEAYDKLVEDENILCDRESEYGADTSAEFITDNNCYLVWFRDV